MRDNIRVLGWANGLLYLLARLLSRVSMRRVRLIKYYFVVQPLDHMDLPAHRGRNIEVREIEREDMPSLDLLRPEHVIAARFDQGARCLAAFNQGELAGYLWYVTGPYQEDEVRSQFVPCPQGEAVWDFDVYVAPRHRISPVFMRLWQVASEDLRSEGFKTTCSRVHAFNAASLNSHRRLGAEITGWGVYLCMGSVQISFFNQSPGCHVSFNARSVPRITVGAAV